MKQQINNITAEDIEAFEVAPFLGSYQTNATKSAFYPGQGTPLGLAYCALKLNGEAGELAEHVGKAMRDDDLIPIVDEGVPGNPYRNALLDDTQLTPERRLLMIKEVGDVLWYVSAICNELGVTMEYVASINLHKLYQRGLSNTLPGSGDDR